MAALHAYALQRHTRDDPRIRVPAKLALSVVLCGIMLLTLSACQREDSGGPTLQSFGLKRGMYITDVKAAIEGKVSGVAEVSEKSPRTMRTSDGDVTFQTHHIHYTVPGTDKLLRVYFWNDYVKTFELK